MDSEEEIGDREVVEEKAIQLTQARDYLPGVRNFEAQFIEVVLLGELQSLQVVSFNQLSPLVRDLLLKQLEVLLQFDFLSSLHSLQGVLGGRVDGDGPSSLQVLDLQLPIDSVGKLDISYLYYLAIRNFSLVIRVDQRNTEGVLLMKDLNSEPVCVQEETFDELVFPTLSHEEKVLRKPDDSLDELVLWKHPDLHEALVEHKHTVSLGVVVLPVSNNQHAV